MLQLRPYQETLIQAVRNEFLQGRRHPCVVAPCGAGKTIIMAWLAQQTAVKGNSVMFAVHRQELIEQSSRTFVKLGIQHGIIAPGLPNLDEPIQIGSIFTVARRLSRMQPPSVIIFDEAHHCKANTWIKVMEAFPNAYVIGLTATPARMGGQGLGDIFQSLLLGPSVKELIDWGNLSKFKYFAPPIKADLDGLRVKYGEYVRSEVSMRMDKSEIIGDVIAQYRKLADGKRAIAYCVSVAHSEHTAEMFRSAGISAQHIDGKTERGVRAAAIESFRRGEIKVLCNVDLISEGFDVPAMEAVLLLRPTQSLTLHIQQSMRPMRPDAENPNKTAIIIDHVGNCYHHGLPDEDREWTLESRPKKQQDRLVSLRTCPKCYGAHRPAPKCPLCGYVYVAEREGPTQRKGDLVEIDELERIRRKQEVGRARSRKDLEEIAIKRGYKLNWINRMVDIKRIRE